MPTEFGTINLPEGIKDYGEGGQAIGRLIQIAIWILIAGAGVYALFNLILAGYGYMSAGDDPKRVSAAWGKIWKTLLGLTIAAGAFVLASVFGRLIFGPEYNILTPTLPTL